MSQLTHTIGEFVRIYWNKNKYVKGFIDDATDSFTEKQLGEDLLKIVKSNALKACIICGFSSIIPIIGENIIAPFFGILFTWLTYLAVNKKVGISLSGNFIKTIVAGVLTNVLLYLIFYYVVIHILTMGILLFFEIIPFYIILWILCKLIDFAINYVIIIASAILYMKIFVNFFANKEDKNNNQNKDTTEISK